MKTIQPEPSQALGAASESSSELSVRVHELSKIYRVYPRPLDRVLEWITRRTRHRRFPALESVSFDLPHGESLGIIGENGAGKSTLLKILSGISRPTSGTVEVRGRIASILELGSGFHPEFSGRENIRINAALLGLGAAQVTAAMPEIVSFSELGDFIDRPVKVYSTGMTMRLAFSIATQVDPEVLIVDEALSVGDGYFQKKCMDRMVELVEGGMTLLFCTHAMYYLTAFCHRAIWLRNGRVAAQGSARDVVARYERFLQEKGRDFTERHHPEPEKPAFAELPAGAPEDSEDREGSEHPEELEGSGDPKQDAGEAVHDDLVRTGKAGRIVDVRLLAVPGGAPTAPSAATAGTPNRLVVEVLFEAVDLEHSFQLALGLDRTDGTQILSVSTHKPARESAVAFGPLCGRQHYQVRAEISPLPLQQGAYTLYVYLLDDAGLHVWDQRILNSAFELVPEEYSIGLLDVECDFELVEP
jgi:ABC-type polysaccharide/polyol phosphate transport system ATPase subunit